MQRHTCDPTVEIHGSAVQAFTKCLNSPNFQSIFNKHGLVPIDVENWYQLQNLLDTLDEINEQTRGNTDMVEVGIVASKANPIPEEMLNLSPFEFFKYYEQNYLSRHRNGDPGAIHTQQIDENHITITLDAAYPDDLMYGVFYGFAKRLFPKGHPFTIKYDATQPRKETGGPTTIYHLQWD